MKTLLIDCYRDNSFEKMKFYRQMCEKYSEIVEVKLAELPQVNFNSIDAVVISGSQWMLSEEDPPDEIIGFLRNFKIPTLGICFGHQLIARAFGAEIKKGTEFIDRDEEILLVEDWQLFAGMGEWLTDSGKRMVLMRESHREFVTPESVEKIGWRVGAISKSCPVEALCHPNLPLYGVQFHPERSGTNGAKLFQNFYYNIVQ